MGTWSIWRHTNLASQEYMIYLERHQSGTTGVHDTVHDLFGDTSVWHHRSTWSIWRHINLASQEYMIDFETQRLQSIYLETHRSQAIYLETPGLQAIYLKTCKLQAIYSKTQIFQAIFSCSQNSNSCATFTHRHTQRTTQINANSICL